MPKNISTPTSGQSNPVVKHDPHPWTVFTSTEDYRIYWDYFKKNLRTSPFDPDSIKRIEELTKDFWDMSKPSDFNIDEIVILLGNLRNSLSIFNNANKAIEAYIEIKITKLMILIERDLIKKKNTLITEKEKNELALSIRNRLFPERTKSNAAYYALKKIASIKNVEAYCFLGKTKLRELSSVVDMTNDDPIGSFFGKYDYKFNIKAIEEDDDFTLKINTMVNIELLNKYKLYPSYESVLEYTKINSKLTKPTILKLAKEVNNATTIDNVLTNSKPIAFERIEIDRAPSYNEFEERCLQLMDIMEDIIDDSYVPQFDPREFKLLLEILHDMNSEIYEFWTFSWEGFDYGEPE